jgi:hypothetical protein
MNKIMFAGFAMIFSMLAHAKNVICDKLLLQTSANFQLGGVNFLLAGTGIIVFNGQQ